jgi:hypothetical protein
MFSALINAELRHVGSVDSPVRNNEEPPEGLGPLTVPLPFVAVPRA